MSTKKTDFFKNFLIFFGIFVIFVEICIKIMYIIPIGGRKMAKSSGYLGFGWIVSLILAIFPITNIILGVLIRIKRNNLIGVVLNIILCPVFYIIDLVSMIVARKIFVLA